MNFERIEHCLDRITEIKNIPDQDRLVMMFLGEIDENLRAFLDENSPTSISIIEEKVSVVTPGGP